MMRITTKLILFIPYIILAQWVTKFGHKLVFINGASIS